VSCGSRQAACGTGREACGTTAEARRTSRTPLGLSRTTLGVSRTTLGVSRRTRWVTPADGAATRVHHWVGSGPILARRGPPDGLRRFETGTTSSSLRQAQDGPPTRAAGKTRRGEPSSEVALRSPRAPEVRARTKVAPQLVSCANIIRQRAPRLSLHPAQRSKRKMQPASTLHSDGSGLRNEEGALCDATRCWRTSGYEAARLWF
jgi:hypothetical protein